ncbi:MAG: hypothetical protein AAF363_09555 [Bacteroidota bacterium]
MNPKKQFLIMIILFILGSFIENYDKSEQTENTPSEVHLNIDLRQQKKVFTNNEVENHKKTTYENYTHPESKVKQIR